MRAEELAAEFGIANSPIQARLRDGPLHRPIQMLLEAGGF
jgi:hypothetical protein